MHILFLSMAVAFLSYGGERVNAQVSVTKKMFTTNLSVGSTGHQVFALQQMLNRNQDTRVANTGPGSPGNETSYFGHLTKNAVVRFQEKYKSEILSPAGLLLGSGFVGFYTRAKLNALYSMPTDVSESPTTQSLSATDNIVKDNEKIDIYAGDKMLENVNNKILNAINSAIRSGSTATATMPTITMADVPSVMIKSLSPKSGAVGTSVSITGTGISSKSAIYFGNNYIVRSVIQNASGKFSFVVPMIPTGLYDIAVRTGDAISNTSKFVIINPQNSAVRIQSVYPTSIKYGETLTIIGSGFSYQNNTVVTTYQEYTRVPSPDGKTLTIQVAPESLRELSITGRGTDKIPLSLYVVNDYGFSDLEKTITILL